MLAHSDPAAAKQLLAEAQDDVLAQWQIYERRAALSDTPAPPGEGHA